MRAGGSDCPLPLLFRLDLCRLCYQNLELGYLASDDVEARATEVDALDVDAEAVGEGDGVGETGGGEEVVVFGAEEVGVFFVAGAETEAEEEAEGVGIVVENGTVVVTLDSLRAFRDGRGYRHIPRYASRAARKTSAGTVLLTACQSTKARST